ncbi:hypothetical protein ACRALDRAFT_209864 [Sodiomyces alcalophilus JCM 7366]|uniref:uncharacterized protein n=1 Tax=Sodiomyces alcalophilus JCM 7366 TaxID=591952 RepID=UPI0039B42B5D
MVSCKCHGLNGRFYHVAELNWETKCGEMIDDEHLDIEGLPYLLEPPNLSARKRRVAAGRHTYKTMIENDSLGRLVLAICQGMVMEGDEYFKTAVLLVSDQYLGTMSPVEPPTTIRHVL